MPDWFCNKNCLNNEVQVDQRMASMRAQMKDIEEAFKQHKLKDTFDKIQALTKYSSPNSIVNSLMLENGTGIQNQNQINKVALKFLTKVFSEIESQDYLKYKKIVKETWTDVDIFEAVN
jgi:hypothetical protein